VAPSTARSRSPTPGSIPLLLPNQLISDIRRADIVAAEATGADKLGISRHSAPARPGEAGTAREELELAAAPPASLARHLIEACLRKWDRRRGSEPARYDAPAARHSRRSRSSSAGFDHRPESTVSCDLPTTLGHIAAAMLAPAHSRAATPGRRSTTTPVRDRRSVRDHGKPCAERTGCHAPAPAPCPSV
jgi:hypothetical protein